MGDSLEFGAKIDATSLGSVGNWSWRLKFGYFRHSAFDLSKGLITEPKAYQYQSMN
jgi:hypothetical protein